MTYEKLFPMYYTKGSEILPSEGLFSPQKDHSKEMTKGFFKSPFIGPFSLIAQCKFKIIANIYFKDLNNRLAFTSV